MVTHTQVITNTHVSGTSLSEPHIDHLRCSIEDFNEKADCTCHQETKSRRLASTRIRTMKAALTEIVWCSVNQEAYCCVCIHCMLLVSITSCLMLLALCSEIFYECIGYTSQQLSCDHTTTEHYTS